MSNNIKFVHTRCLQKTLVKKLFTPLSVTLLIATTSLPTLAITYGVYDSRGMAMGGAATAVGTYAQAAFYNPALLAFHEVEEEEGRDGRTYFPNLVAEISDAAESGAEAANDDLDVRLSTAIRDYNAAMNQANAVRVAAGAQELRDTLNDIANKNISIDAFIGLSVSEPSKFEGGAFYVGSRLVGGGLANVSAADSSLLNDYVDALNQIAAGTDPLVVAVQYPNVFNGTALNDPTTTLTSTADLSAMAISEWGLAMARQWSFWGQAVGFGITPKLMRVDAFRDNADFNDGTNSLTTRSFSDSQATHFVFNADLGITTVVADHYWVSLTAKDIFQKTFSTVQEPDPITGLAPTLEVTLSTRTRLGLGYQNDSFSVGVDYDLQQAKPIANEAPTQELCFGAEYRLFDGFALRAGYRNDRTGLRGNLVSGGIGYQWKRVVMDFAYATGGGYKGGGLQLGWAF